MTTMQHDQGPDDATAVTSPRHSLPPKKQQPANVERKRAPYISAAVARPHILETTIELLRTSPSPA